ncbi:hypothetical protein BaRGS_00029734 [Batillaria attramentaria]|uniref:Uncharacterized protein n=1 Tax=Batillaria attramentaria TaxID=370345 RepID=A0ABD0JVS5_9CAEN
MKQQTVVNELNWCKDYVTPTPTVSNRRDKMKLRHYEMYIPLECTSAIGCDAVSEGIATKLQLQSSELNRADQIGKLKAIPRDFDTSLERANSEFNQLRLVKDRTTQKQYADESAKEVIVIRVPDAAKSSYRAGN